MAFWDSWAIIVGGDVIVSQDVCSGVKMWQCYAVSCLMMEIHGGRTQCN